MADTDRDPYTGWHRPRRGGRANSGADRARNSAAHPTALTHLRAGDTFAKSRSDGANHPLAHGGPYHATSTERVAHTNGRSAGCHALPIGYASTIQHADSGAQRDANATTNSGTNGPTNQPIMSLHGQSPDRADLSE